jgi:Fe-S-cluster containining protein
MQPPSAPTLASEHLALPRLRRKAKRANLFAALTRIYALFPETTCENCARCCFESPGVFFVEHLHLLDHISRLPQAGRDALMHRALHELLFSWIDPQRQCIFLEASRCTLYDRRPLACRLFGLVAPAEREQAEAEARMGAREEARRLRRLGIEVPEEVVTRSLASCDRVRDRQGRPVRVNGDAFAARVARLDEALLPREVVIREFCFYSLPERIGALLLGREGVEALRLQLLRRAQRGENPAALVEQVWEMVRGEWAKAMGQR